MNFKDALHAAVENASGDFIKPAPLKALARKNTRRNGISCCGSKEHSALQVARKELI